jgi:hypothetical protein
MVTPLFSGIIDEGSQLVGASGSDVQQTTKDIVVTVGRFFAIEQFVADFGRHRDGCTIGTLGSVSIVCLWHE